MSRSLQVLILISLLTLTVDQAWARQNRMMRSRTVRTPQLNMQYHRAEAAWKSGSSMLEAKVRVDRVLKALPEDQDARKLRAQVLLALDRPVEALIDAREAVRLDPDDGEAYLILCEAARRHGDIADAKMALDKAAERILDAPDMHIRLSWSAVELKEYDKAEAYARIALAQGPEIAAAYYQLARVFFLKDQPDDAAIVLSKGFKAEVLETAFVRNDEILRHLVAHPLLSEWLTN